MHIGRAAIYRAHAPSTGITLLEVMIAVLVMSLGLLGLASLLPIGRFHMAAASKLDRGSTLGRAAFRDLLVRGALRPEMWLYGNITTPLVGTGNQFQSATIGPANVSVAPPAVPLVLDPLQIGFNAPSPYGPGTTSTLKFVETFPYGIPGSGSGPEASAPIIPRITLRNIPSPYITGNVHPIGAGAADRLFRSTDDLVFTTANTDIASTTWPKPSAMYLNASGINSSAILQSNGGYSWLVTIPPDLSQTLGAPSNVKVNSAVLPYAACAASTRQFTVSVVVLSRRELQTYTSPQTTMADPGRGERMCWVDFLSRGNARLRTSATSQAAAEKLLTVETNQWLMVTGRAPSFAPNPSSSGGPWMQTTIRWYQIASAAPAVLSYQNQWYRPVYLIGPDWTVNSYIDPKMYVFNDENSFRYADFAMEPPTGHGTLITGAVGVFEKIVNLDGNSLWSN